MKQQRAAGRQTLHRFAAFYGLFVLVLTILLMPVYLYVEKTVRQTELERCTRRMEDGAATIDAALRTLLNLSLTTENDSRFLSLRVHGNAAMNVTSLPEMRTLFSGLLVNDPLLCDVGLILDESAAITRQRTYISSLHYRLYPDHLRCEGKDYAAWRQWLHGYLGTFAPEMAYTSADYGSYQALTYGARWPMGSVSSNYLLYATIRTSALFSALADADVLAQGAVRIRGMNGQVLAQQGTAPSGSEIISYHSATARAIYEITIPQSVLDARLGPVNRLIIGYALGLLAVAIGAIGFFAYFSAKPMRKLVTMMGSMKPGELPRNLLEEDGLTSPLYHDYQYLASNILSLGSQMETYRNTIQTQQQLLRVSVWEQALTRGLYSPRALTRFHAIFPDFPGRYRVAVVRYALPEPMTLEQLAAAQLELRIALGQCAEDAQVHSMENGLAVILLPEPVSPAFEEKLQTLAENGPARLQACALSDPFEDASEIHKAYLQACDLAFLPADGALPLIRRMEHMPQESMRIPVSPLDMETLYRALRTGNLPMAQQILQSCLDEVLQDPDNAAVNQYVYRQFANILARLRLEHPALLMHIVIPTYDHARLRALFTQELPACLAATCQALEPLRENEPNNADEILAYIQAHLQDSQLGVQQLAEAFSMSPPTLQKTLRTVTGTTIADYIDALRINLACKLLTETRASVGAIAAQCGYTSTNSFYKAFKRRCGMAPSALPRK